MTRFRTLSALAVCIVWSGLPNAAPAVAQDRTPIRTVKGGIVDEVSLYADTLPATARVVIRPFSATEADITKGEKKDETRRMQAAGPGILAERFVVKLTEFGPFTSVSALESGATVPPDALVVEGKFTELDPGSRAKRYFVGFGAGKSGVTVEGSLKAADSTVLATFRQRRVGVMGIGGGDSMGKLISDTKNIAEDLATLLSAWAKGKNLK
jgi:hypothetical protein